MWWITAQKHGASAPELERVLGLGSYVTAWTWLHKLRRAMVRPGRDRLQGRVELDELFVGGVTSPGGIRVPRSSYWSQLNSQMWRYGQRRLGVCDETEQCRRESRPQGPLLSAI